MYLLLNSFNRACALLSVVALLLVLVKFVRDVQADLLQTVQFVLQTGTGVLLLLQLALK